MDEGSTSCPIIPIHIAIHCVPYLPYRSNNCYQENTFRTAFFRKNMLFFNFFPPAVNLKGQGDVLSSHSCFSFKKSCTHTHIQCTYIYLIYIHTYTQLLCTWNSRMIDESNYTGQTAREKTLCILTVQHQSLSASAPDVPPGTPVLTRQDRLFHWKAAVAMFDQSTIVYLTMPEMSCT